MKKIIPASTRAYTSISKPTGLGTVVQLLRVRAQLLNLVAGALGKTFADVTGRLGAIKGRIFVTGESASECAARHTAREFTSSGIPSLFAGADSFSGEVIRWLIQPGDAVLLFSSQKDSSFEEEVLFVTSCMEIPLFIITNKNIPSADSVHVLKIDELAASDEECGASPVIYMVLGEAIAQEILRIRGMKKVPENTLKSLGGSRFRRVSEIMRTGDELPLLKGDAVLAEARTLLRRHAPCVVGVMKRDKLSGVISDADFRRMGSRIELNTPVTKAMRPPSATLTEDDSVAEALRLLRESGASALFVLRDRRPVGLVGPYDCLKA